MDAATSTICSVCQSAVVNVNSDGNTVTSSLPGTLTVAVTVADGSESSTTTYPADEPSSIVRLVGSTVTAAVSSSVTDTVTESIVTAS